MLVVQLSDREMTVALRHYQALIFTTAQRLVASGVLDELEDIEQLLRLKAWKGLRAYDPAKARGMSVDRYIFMVIRDQAKDIAKRKRTVVLMIEDQAARDAGTARDAFDARYLAQSEEETFGMVETPAPLVPNTLSELERGVLLGLYRGLTHREIALRLETSTWAVSGAVRGLRSKLADWRPASAEREAVVAR